MKVNIGGFDYECRAARRDKNSITLYLGKYDENSNELTTAFVNMSIEKAYVIDGEWEYDFYAEPEPIPSGDDSSVWDELDAAYQKGVDSV